MFQEKFNLQKKLMAGHIIRDKDLTSIRPGTGILGNKINLFIGKK